MAHATGSSKAQAARPESILLGGFRGLRTSLGIKGLGFREGLAISQKTKGLWFWASKECGSILAGGTDDKDRRSGGGIQGDPSLLRFPYGDRMRPLGPVERHNVGEVRDL